MAQTGLPIPALRAMSRITCWSVLGLIGRSDLLPVNILLSGSVFLLPHISAMGVGLNSLVCCQDCGILFARGGDDDLVAWIIVKWFWKDCGSTGN